MKGLLVIYILLCLIALITLVFCVKIQFELIYDETFSFSVKALFFTFRIYPENDFSRFMGKKKKKPRQEDKPAEEEAEEEKGGEPKENIILRFYKKQGFDGVMVFLGDIVSALNGFFGSVLKRALVFEKLFIQIYVAKGDAARTAIAYGKTCAAVFTALGYICGTMSVKKYDADINVDYLAQSSTAMINTTVSLRPIRLTNALVVLGMRALLAYLRARKRGKKRKPQQSEGCQNRKVHQ